jgi:hypothetical protein
MMAAKPSLRAPQPKLDVLRRGTEVVVRAEQDQIVLSTELDEHSVDGTDLYTATVTRVSDVGGFDMVFPVGLKETEGGEPLDQLAACSTPGKALEKFLQDQTRREDLIGSLESVLKRLDLRRRRLRIAAERERPDAGVDKKAHGLRERSAL